jgi:hypothetical protein
MDNFATDKAVNTLRSRSELILLRERRGEGLFYERLYPLMNGYAVFSP